MKKSLIAVAAFGVVSGLASAQSNIAIYGVVDVGVSHDSNAVGSTTAVNSGILNGSRLGFKGTEDLGNGLSAIFTIENGFAADTGAAGQGGLLFGRQAFVGLAGVFGVVKFGRQTLPVYANNEVFDPFSNGMAGDSARLINFSGSRANNVVSYGYDNNGFRSQLQYAHGEVAGNSAAGRTIAGLGGYRKGPVDAILAYQRTNNSTGNVSGKTALLGGNYDFGAFKAFAAYAWNKDVIAPSGVISLGADMRNALLGLAIPVGAAGSVRLSHVILQNRAVDNANSKQTALGYIHDLSKRTALYASISRLSNERAASLQSGAAGASDNLYDFGVRHRF